MSERATLARAFRDWVHSTDLSLCSVSADECPDWPLAYHLADLALGALRPARCPTCGSDDPKVRQLVRRIGAERGKTSFCADSFHQSDTESG